MAGLRDQHVVFNAHAQVLFRDVNARLDRDHHSRLKRAAIVAWIVHVEPDMVTQAVNEILAKRSALAVFSMRIDVVVGDIHQPVFFAFAGEVRAGLHRRERLVLRAENDFVDFALARCELAISGKGARDVRRVTGILRANVKHYDVAILNLARQFVIVERGRIRPRTDNRRIAFCFGAAQGVHFHHSCGHLIFVEARAHHFHCFQLRIQG